MEVCHVVNIVTRRGTHLDYSKISYIAEVKNQISLLINM